ncbi:MAG TPA: DUF354 domain-containing protein [Thermodesulfobacteriota bacterium]|nr:DUF354 domain-containing protein [Thermodesulfobacteriota bacterium]
MKEAGKKIWIDLDNSPHVPFFKPIIQALEEKNVTVVVTGRECFQVRGLVSLHNINCKIVGRHYGKNKLLKVVGLLVRAAQIAPVAIREKPSITLSHGSRSQVLVSTCLRIPSVCIDDYEYARMIVRPKWILTPEIIPHSSIRHPVERVLRYPGIKEDVYVPNLTPNDSIREDLNIKKEDLMVIVRPPATEAHYHNPESEKMLHAVLSFLCEEQGTKIVILPRSTKQREELKKEYRTRIEENRIILPPSVVEGVNLIWQSDLVISGGGTMNREAAALGVPVYSIFRGTIGAVDKYLVKNNRLILLEDIESIRRKILLRKREMTNSFKNVKRPHPSRNVLDSILCDQVSYSPNTLVIEFPQFSLHPCNPADQGTSHIAFAIHHLFTVSDNPADLY